MFYELNLLSYRHNGKFSRPWVAATMRHHYKLTYNDIMSLDFEYICDEILKFVMSNSSRPHKRFSLRLSAQLVHGLAILHRRKVILIQDEIFASYSGTFLISTPKNKKSGKGGKNGNKNKQPGGRNRKGPQEAINEPIPEIVTIDEAVQDLMNYEIPNVSQHDLIALFHKDVTVNEESITLLEAPANPSNYIEQQDFGENDLAPENLIPENLTSLHPEDIVSATLNNPEIPDPPVITIQKPSTDQENLTFSPMKRKKSTELNEVRHSKKSLQFEEANYAAAVPEDEITIENPNNNIEILENIVLLTIEESSVPQKQRGTKRKRFHDIIDLEHFLSNETIIEAVSNTTIHTKALVRANPKKAQSLVSMFFSPVNCLLSSNLKSLFNWTSSSREVELIDSMNFSKNSQGNLQVEIKVVENESVVMRPENALSHSTNVSLTPILPRPSLKENVQPLKGISELSERPTNISAIQSTSNAPIAPEVEQNLVEQFQEFDIPPLIDQSVNQQCPEFDFPQLQDQNFIKTEAHEQRNINKRQVERNAQAEETEGIEFISNTDKIKQFYFKKINDMRNKGIEEFEFSTLCPPTATSRRNAAIAFFFILELAKKKCVDVTSKPNSLVIDKIIILKI